MLTLFLLTVLIYHRCFRRYDADPEPELGLPAKRLTFLSGPNRLQGYLCGTGDTLAVLAPGLGNGAFSYAPQIQWLAKAGLRVFHLTTPAATAARAGRAGAFRRQRTTCAPRCAFWRKTAASAAAASSCSATAWAAMPSAAPCREAGWMRPCASAG